jgi:hypothetical protein
MDESWTVIVPSQPTSTRNNRLRGGFDQKSAAWLGQLQPEPVTLAPGERMNAERATRAMAVNRVSDDTPGDGQFSHERALWQRAHSSTSTR